jgi:hypothetical protein
LPDKVEIKSLAKKGWTTLKAQNFTAASVSTNLKTASRQFRGLLGTGLASGLSATAGYVGLAAAGLRAAGGAELLYDAIKNRNLRRGLDGVRDLGSSAVLGLASASMFALRKTLFPITTGFNTVRGAFNFAAGWRAKDRKRQSQGALDAVRSLGQTARALRTLSPWLATGGLWLAPIAGGMQAHQGWKNLTRGLTENKNSLEVKGITDIASAVGVTLLLTGVAATPGLAIFSAAQAIHTVYSMSKTVRKHVDKGIDRLEPTGLKALEGLNSLGNHGRALLERLGGPFPRLLAPRTEVPEPERTGTTRRLEEDGWEAYTTIWPDSGHQQPAVAEAESSYDPSEGELAA